MIRSHGANTVSHPEARPPLALDHLVRDFMLRLCDQVEAATLERGLELIEAIFSAVRAGPAARLARREMKQAVRQRRRLLTTLTRRFLRDIELATRARARKAVAREWAARARAAARAAAAERATTPTPARRRPRRRPLPPPPDPEQLKRDAETARLRALLRPAAEEWSPPTPTPPSLPVVPPPRPVTPGELLRALEKEIQNAVPSLAMLGAERCGAQIAVWAAQVRQMRDRLAPEVLAVMRAAIRIFLEHLTELRAAMEAHFVDALDPKWRAPDWSVYIEVNRARVEGRPPALSASQLETYHRAMLRALVQPHRRNVPAQAIPVINAAAAFLPADDGQLRSAIRRHSSEWQADADPPTESPAEPSASGGDPSDEAGGEAPSADRPVGDAFAGEAPSAEADSPAADPTAAVTAPPVANPAAGATDSDPAPEASSAATAGDPVQSEFDQPWTK
jgi:hypothetical protein